MAFPASLTLVTAACRFDLPPSGGATGSVLFVAGYPLTGPTDGSVVPPFTIVGTLAANGTCSVVLPATNDPQWTPVGWAYEVVAQVAGTSRRGTLQLDYQTASVELADLIQWDGAAVAGTTYIPLSYRGAVNGVASLGSDGKVPAGQLPSSSGGAVVVKHVQVTSGSITPQAAGAWAAVTGTPTISIAAVAGDYVSVDFLSFMYQPVGSTTFLDLAVLVGGSPVRYLSSGTGTPATEGSPSLYPQPGTYRDYGPVFGFQVTSGDLSGGTVTVGFATKGAGTGTIFGDANYPLRWRAMNYGAVSFS